MKHRSLVAAAFALAAFVVPGPSAGPALAGPGSDREPPVFFEDPDPRTLGEIMDWIGLFDAPAWSQRARARDGLVDIGYWSVPHLLEEGLDSKRSPFRSNALLCFRRLADPRTLQPTREAVINEDRSGEWPPVIASLVLGSLRDGDDRTLAAFRTAMASRKIEKRKVAIMLACGKLNNLRREEALAMVEAALDERTPNPAVHYAAMLVLGFFPNRVYELDAAGIGLVPTERVRRALADKDAGMRLSAVLTLALSRLDAFHDLFIETLRTDGDREVRIAALLGLWNDPRPETTDLIIRVLEAVRSTSEEQRVAAYLLNRRSDPRSLAALLRIATAPRAPEVAASAVVALGGLEHDEAVRIVLRKLADRNATVRAAAAVGCTRFRREADLVEAERHLDARLKAGEPDEGARADMDLARSEVRRRAEALRTGGSPDPEKPIQWIETGTVDLLESLARSEEQRVMDLVNLRVIQVLGIEGLFPYRPGIELSKRAGESNVNTSVGPERRDHAKFFEQYDVRIELETRPYFTIDDYPNTRTPVLPGDDER